MIVRLAPTVVTVVRAENCTVSRSGLRDVAYALAVACSLLTNWSSLAFCQAAVVLVEEDEDAVRVEEPQIVFTDAQFDQYVYDIGSTQSVVIVNGVQQVGGDVSNNASNNADRARQQFEATISSEIQAVHQVCSLSEQQKAKLLLAGRGDYAEYLDQLADLRQQMTTRPLTQREYSELIGKLRPLRMTVVCANLLNDDSLFRKTLRGCLTAQQVGPYRDLLRARRAKIIESVLLNWDRNPAQVKLTGETRQKFINLLVERGRLPHYQATFIHYLVLSEVDRLAEHVQPLLSEADWTRLQTQVQQAKRAEAGLRRSGLWPVVDDDADEPPVANKE